MAQPINAWDTLPWIPVIDESGTRKVTLRTAFAEAHLIKGLSTPPLATPMTVGIMATLMRRALSNSCTTPERLGEAWETGYFDMEAIDAYATPLRERFDLTGPTPFLQTPDLSPTTGTPKPASALLLHTARGNNVPLFSAVTEGDHVELSLPDALLGMIELFGYDTAGIKTGAQGDPQVKAGKTTGNPTGVLGQLGATLPMGRSLFHTILLNVPLGADKPEDLPAWERDLTPTWETREVSGFNDQLTFPSRRVRMILNDAQDAVIGAVVSSGDRLVRLSEDYEPRCRWADAREAAGAKRPLRWRPGQAAWRGMESLLALDSSAGLNTSLLLHQISRYQETWLAETYPLSLFCIGASYGTQNAVIEDVIVDRLPLPIAALRAGDDLDIQDALIAITTRADSVRRALNSLHTNLRESFGAEKISWDVGEHPGDDTMPALDEPTHRLLRGLQTSPGSLDDGILAWEKSILAIAWKTASRLLDQAPPTAFLGRGEEKKHMNLAKAETFFRAALRKALPIVHSHQQQPSTPPEGIV